MVSNWSAAAGFIVAVGAAAPGSAADAGDAIIVTASRTTTGDALFAADEFRIDPRAMPTAQALTDRLDSLAGINAFT